MKKMMEERPWKTKWVAAVASIWIQCFTGASYAFGMYSSVLKNTQSYDQSTLDAVSVYKDIGANVGVLSGLLYTAVVASSYGPWVVILVGLAQWFMGYFLIWASVVGLIQKPPVAAMCFFMFLAGHSQPFFSTANVVTTVRNFPDYGGTAVGIMKGFLGLSGAILVQMYHTFSEGNPTGFILVLAIVPSLISLFTMPFVRAYDTTTSSDKTHLDGLSLISLIIVVYLMALIMLENILGLSASSQIISFVLLIFMLALPLLVAFRARCEENPRFTSSLECPTPERTALLDSPKPKKKISSENVLDETVETDDSNVLQAMCTMNFWLLFLAMICGMGTGLATVNNIRQVGESLSYPTTQLNSLVSLWSIWNFLGRFGAGYISDRYLHNHAWPRPVFMAITLSVMALGHSVMASGLQGNLYLGSLLVGLAYGSQWSLMPTITSEIFGIKHMGTIYYTISIASPVGSYIFSVKVIGYFYDKVAYGDDHSCFGNHCFSTSFVIMSAVALFGSLVACVLVFRTKRFYAKLVAKRSIN